MNLEKVFLGVMIISVVGIIFLFSIISAKTTNLNFDDEIMEDLNNKFKETSKDSEFFGYLEVEDNNVLNFNFVGYKNLIDGSVDLENKNVEVTNYSIHNHPNGWCYPSPQDMLSQEKVICIMCDLNKVRCFENE
ncbi:MAG: hypothetical protein ACOCV1_04425 [Bacillota bacterium]